MGELITDDTEKFGETADMKNVTTAEDARKETGDSFGGTTSITGENFSEVVGNMRRGIEEENTLGDATLDTQEDGLDSLSSTEIVLDDSEDEENAEISEEISDRISGNSLPAVDEKPQRREVYKMPDVDTGKKDGVIFLPANLIIMAVTWQIKLIYYAFSSAFSFFGFLQDFAVHPIQRSTDIKNQLSEQLAKKEVGPKLGTLAKKSFRGILAATYVGILLSFLVVPVILAQYLFVSRYIEEPLDIKAPIYFNYAEARPSASFILAPLLMQRSSWYKLHASITLTLPESDYNRHLGMFQVSAVLLSDRNETLQRTSRPCMLRFQSVPIRYARTLIYSVPVLLDISGEYQLLHLDMIEFTRESSLPVGNVKFELEPRAGFGPGDGLPEIYESEIRIRTELPWRKSTVYKWKRTIYVWTATMLFIFEVGVVLCCSSHLLLPTMKKKQQYKQEAPIRRKPKSLVKKRVSFQETCESNDGKLSLLN